MKGMARGRRRVKGGHTGRAGRVRGGRSPVSTAVRAVGNVVQLRKQGRGSRVIVRVPRACHERVSGNFTKTVSAEPWLGARLPWAWDQ